MRCWLTNEWHLGLASCLLYWNFLFKVKNIFFLIKIRFYFNSNIYFFKFQDNFKPQNSISQLTVNFQFSVVTLKKFPFLSWQFNLRPFLGFQLTPFSHKSPTNAVKTRRFTLLVQFYILIINIDIFIICSAPSWSPAPSAFPTRTAVAIAIPMGICKTVTTRQSTGVTLTLVNSHYLSLPYKRPLPTAWEYRGLPTESLRTFL